jgi:undecaprenyl pyrophosphate phosphatase UppP
MKQKPRSNAILLVIGLLSVHAGLAAVALLNYLWDERPLIEISNVLMLISLVTFFFVYALDRNRKFKLAQDQSAMQQPTSTARAIFSSLATGVAIVIVGMLLDLCWSNAIFTSWPEMMVSSVMLTAALIIYALQKKRKYSKEHPVEE